MSPNERRAELARTIIFRKFDKMKNLAHEFGVNIRTIRRDIDILTATLRIEVLRGHDGGVRLVEHYNPYKDIFNREQVRAIQNALSGNLDEKDNTVLHKMLDTYAPQTYREEPT